MGGRSYELAWDLVPQEEMHAACIASFQGGSSAGFATLLNKIIRPLGHAPRAFLARTGCLTIGLPLVRFRPRRDQK